MFVPAPQDTFAVVCPVTVTLTEDGAPGVIVESDTDKPVTVGNAINELLYAEAEDPVDVFVAVTRHHTDAPTTDAGIVSDEDVAPDIAVPLLALYH